MSSSNQLATPKIKKRVRQLISYYEDYGTPRKMTSATDVEPTAVDFEESPTKKMKLSEVISETPSSVDVVIEEQSLDLDPTVSKARESRSARKSRRLKEATMAKYSMRIFCATEVLSTERTYVEGLQHLHKVWMVPLSKIVSENDIHRMFGNIVSIMRFNETLLRKLERRMKTFDPETTLIGDIFISLVPFLSMYTDYCCNYGEGMNLVGKFKADNPDFTAAMLQASADSNGMDLQDYCITPVQRVPRYRLLLETLIKNTSPEHPDYANLTTAIQLVSDKATEINKKMNLVEQQKKMMDLYRRFVTPPMASEDLVQPWRYLAAEFKATLMTQTEDVEINLYLFNDIFILATQEESNGKLTAVTAQPLWNCYLKKLEPGWTLASRELPPFQVVNPSGTWNLVVAFKAKFKTDFESMRDAVLANSVEKRQKRALIKLFPNDDTQEWNAVEPAPTYASNRVSTQILAAETTEFTKMALEELLSENREIFEARSVTPAKTPKKSRLGKLKDAMTPLKWSSKKSTTTTSHTPAAGSGAAGIPFGSATATTTTSTTTTAPNNALSSIATSLSYASAMIASPNAMRQGGPPVTSQSDPAITSAHTPSSRMSVSMSTPHMMTLDAIGSPSFAPSAQTLCSGSSQNTNLMPGILSFGGDKENNGHVDAFNQADVIRSTIAKLSQSSAVLNGKTASSATQQTNSAPCLATSASSTKHKKSHSSHHGSTDSPSIANLIGSPVEARRRRHKKDNSRVPCSPLSTVQ